MIKKKILASKAATAKPKPTKIEYTTRLEPNSVTIFEKGKTKALFQLVLSQRSVPFCCGLEEVGEFYTIHNSPTLPEKNKVEAVSELFHMLHQNCYKTNIEEECITGFFTLIDNSVCNLIEKSIKNNPNYKLVKTFINVSSGEENKLFITIN